MDRSRPRTPVPALAAALAPGRRPSELQALTYAPVRPRPIPLPPGDVARLAAEPGPVFPDATRPAVPCVPLNRHTTATPPHAFRHEFRQAENAGGY